jgi:isoamylase
VLRSQRGNNNAYCQNNELSWFNWDETIIQKDFLRFAQQLIGFVQKLYVFKHDEPLIVTPQPIIEPAIVWHGVQLGQPDWSEDSHSLAFTLRYRQHDELLHIMLNAFWEPLTFELPPLILGQHWKRIVDTALSAPTDFCPEEIAPTVDHSFYEVAARASVVLMGTTSSL